MEKIYGMDKLVGLQLFWSRTPTFSSGTPTFCQMGVLNSCFQNPSESSDIMQFERHFCLLNCIKLFFPEKLKKILGLNSKFRWGWITLNTVIFFIWPNENKID